MQSSFGGLTDAAAALAAQRYALDVVGQNVANAATAGYFRQRAELAETGAVVGAPSLYATQQRSTGVTANGTTRMDAPVLVARSRVEHGRDESLGAQAATLDAIESLVDEPSDNGLAEQLNTFWNSWGTVANYPDSLAACNVVLQQASGIAKSLTSMSGVLSQIATTTTDALSQAVSDMNALAGTLTTLNRSIAIASASGTPSNTLLDQRDALLMRLAELGGAQTTLQSDGTATIQFGGQTLVTGTAINLIGLTGSQLDVGGVLVNPTGGEAEGMVTALTMILPTYQGKLDAVANALAATVNSAQAAGFDLAGNAGSPMFSGTSAATISVAMTDPTALAASGTAGGNLDASNALAMSSFGDVPGGADVEYRQLIATLASQSQQATQRTQIQQTVTTSVDTLVESTQGVSIDEEASSLLTYQRAYQASSRVLTTVDELLDTLINSTGRVGR